MPELHRFSTSHDDDGKGPISRAIQLDEKDPLPRTELNFTIDEVKRFGTSEEQGFAMGVAVRILVWSEIDCTHREIVMAVTVSARREGLQGAR
jgi:hypothetical protein